MQDKIAIVTGAASGIGAEVARQLAGQGVKVAVFDVAEEAGRAVADEVGGEFVRCDVSDYDNFHAAVVACVERLGVPEFAHLNAGVMTVGANEPFLPLEEVTLDQYRRIIGVNLDGVFNGFKALLPRMRDNGGAITATASIAGLGALPFDPLYGSTKHAVIGLVRAVAAANEGGKVRINCICPGGVDTAIVPEALKSAGFDAMPPAVMAAEVVDLLNRGANGEIRVKLKEREAFDVPAMDLSA